MDQAGRDIRGGGGGADPEQESFAGFLDRHTAEMSGWLAWLITDLQKKGAAENAERVDRLSERFDDICRRLDALGRALQGAPAGNPASGSEEATVRLASELRAGLESTQRLVSRLTDEGEPFTEERDRQLVERFVALENAIGEGERRFDIEQAS